MSEGIYAFIIVSLSLSYPLKNAFAFSAAEEQSSKKKNNKND